MECCDYCKKETDEYEEISLSYFKSNFFNLDKEFVTKRFCGFKCLLKYSIDYALHKLNLKILIDFKYIED